MSTPPRSPVEQFATIILWLGRAVDGPSMWGHFSRPLALLIINRLREINQLFGRIAARVAAGTYAPRRPAATPRPHTTRRPRQPNQLPQGFAWLVKLLPETAVYGSQLQFLFTDPQMAALLEAAPAAVGRPIRSLCRMLGVAPPKILAPPAKPRPPRAASTAEPKAPPAPPPPLPPLPVWLRPPPAHKRAKLARLCRPPPPRPA